MEELNETKQRVDVLEKELADREESLDIMRTEMEENAKKADENQLFSRRKAALLEETIYNMEKEMNQIFKNLRK